MENIITNLKTQLKDKKVLVAVSTGIDSSVLLDILIKNKETLNIEIVVAHVNHQRREESEKEAEYIKEYCNENNIKIYTKTLSKVSDGNFQEWARKERMAFFYEIARAENIKYVLLAHHAQDNLETILMRLIRSSSLKGYAGIEELSRYKDIYIYRPLLRVTKDQIKEYAKNHNVRYFDDKSNEEDKYFRNRIRKYIIPSMEEENPKLYQAINDFSKTLINASQIIEDETNKFIENKVLVHNNIISFSQNNFKTLSPFLATEVLFTLLKPYGFSKENVEEIIKQINASKPLIINKIRPNLTMVKEYGMVHFTKETLETEPFFLEIKEEGVYKLPKNREIVFKNNLCEFKANKGNICYNNKELPIYIRTKREGDFIRYSHGTKKVSDILTNLKVSWLERHDILLLCNKDGEVTDILGYRVNNK
jgi:tRNA(Ile)-lysidine synthetase-like protein